MRRDFPYLLAILMVALGVRLYGPWPAVLGGPYVNFLETDAWYHVRLIENQVRNWPWRVTEDPYAAPGGQFVPIAPFFDTMTATAVLVAHGRDATAPEIERLAAFVPPVLGTLTVAALWAVGRLAFERRAALLGAALLAVLPGHFLDRTQLGFYDHHALEALLAVTTLWAIAVALRTPGNPGASALAGASLGLYLLGWSGSAFLLAILGGWLLLVLVASSQNDLRAASRVTGIASVVALLFVLAFQERRMFRYESQVLGAAALGALGGAAHVAAVRVTSHARGLAAAYAALGFLLIVGAGLVVASATGILPQILADVARLAPNPARMGVLEARPLFLYTGTWNWAQPWTFFRAGFFLGAIALLLFATRVVRDRRPLDLLIWVATAAMFVATYGQNRFGYYLVPMCALMAGWLGGQVLEWGVTAPSGGRPGRSRWSIPIRREVAVAAVVGGMFAPSIVPSILVASRPGSLADYWADTMVWLREHSTPPFSSLGGDGYYYARYPDTSPRPDYSVMNWWDHGYWVAQIARRVPVANPTQARAPTAALFYAATSEADAVERLHAERARYVISDWELPFRYNRDGAIMGRFQNVVDWAGARHADYYEVMYRRSQDGWVPVWVFFEPYYRSMAFRLSVLGGAAAVPAPGSTSVIVVGERVDSTGLRFREIVSDVTYSTYGEAAAAAARATASGRTLVVGLDPWRAAFPIEALTRLREVHAARTDDQSAGESPWVRVFEVTP